jgi:hypothetical protein
LKIEKGPARVSWKGPDKYPTQIVVLLELGEELSPASGERFWRQLAIVVPIITALIGAAATWVGKPGPGPAPQAHMLWLRVDPNDVEASGLPRAKITLNNQEVQQPVDYKVESDVMAVVDVSKAFDLVKTLGAAYQSQRTVVTSSIDNLNTVFKLINDLTNYANGDICSGGAHGQPSPDRGTITAKATAISDKLRAMSSELGRASAIDVTVPK